MTPKEIAKAEQAILAGLAAAEAVVEAKARELKTETPGLPLEALRLQALHYHARNRFSHRGEIFGPALNILSDWKELADAS